MNITECSLKLRELTEHHANYQLNFEDYRIQRKVLLDSLDQQYNGVVAEQIDTLLEPIIENETQQDKTQPYLASKIGRCISFLKRNNEN
ncbi:hypothetical protein [Psychromonas sp. Urea-02u-13]|uniref:hypothetical protein n=1 Tax=Psychromonas sp. Urea-02u-13 TaxID=2058326 RepID=UPI000C31FCE1|nr:hypothetical protein [Psychromonas sp. Urea-02u-13]PKG38779.1 hypothetical protein CXF74_11820 [Psychromonas sp. Urea-02u-13]